MSSKEQVQEKKIVILDVGSGSVGAGFVHYVDKATPKILAASRARVRDAIPGMSYNRVFLSMMAAATEALSEIFEKNLGAPEEIRVYLRAPWIATETRKIKRSSPKTFVFTKGDAEDLINSESEAISQTFSGNGEEKEGYLILEKRVEEMRLNGYKVSKMPEKMSVESVDMKAFFSITPVNVLEGIEEAIHRYYYAPITYRSFARSFCQVANQYTPDIKNFLIVDVGALMSEIGVVRDCVLVESMTFPEGYTHLQESGSTTQKGHLDAFIENDLHPELHKKTQENLKPAEEKWLRGFSETLDRFSGMLSLPSTVLLISDGPMPDWYARALEGERFAQYLVTVKKFTVILVKEVSLQNLCTSENCSPDVLLMSEALEGNE